MKQHEIDRLKTKLSVAMHDAILKYEGKLTMIEVIDVVSELLFRLIQKMTGKHK